jgi:ADP-dependent NAD(P)H-hydrate dehydratase / NAD(P)H-hydrate epimerase
MATTHDPTTRLLLPASDPVVFEEGLDIDALGERWRAQALLEPMTGSEMRGVDARAQRLGVPGEWLMEQAGTAVAAATLALMRSTDRSSGSLALILCGPGNNGGDGLVAARHLAAHGIGCEVLLLTSGGRPTTPDAERNWDRLDGLDRVHCVSTARDSDVALYLNGIERAGVVVDALLGTGVSGTLREPVRTAVDVVVRAREAQVPVLAVDTPTAVDLSSGEPSNPVVRADVTITFHRPKEGLRARLGKLLAGRVLVAPIGIPLEADIV